MKRNYVSVHSLFHCLYKCSIFSILYRLGFHKKEENIPEYDKCFKKVKNDWNVKIFLAREKDFAIWEEKGYTVHNYK